MCCSICSFSVSEKKWTELDEDQHRAHAMRLLDSLEVIAREKRLKVARAILYMAQGESTLTDYLKKNFFLNICIYIYIEFSFNMFVSRNIC